MHDIDYVNQLPAQMSAHAIATPPPHAPSGTTHDILAETFLKRSFDLLRRIASLAPSDRLSAALAAPSGAGGIASLLSDLSPIGIDLDTVDPLAQAMARGIRAKEELLERAGGAWNGATVAAALGISRQAVDKRRQKETLLGVQTGAGDYLYPRCQFTERGVVDGLPVALGAFADHEPWTQLAVLITPTAALDGRTVLDALRAGERDAAVAVIRRYGVHGA